MHKVVDRNLRKIDRLIADSAAQGDDLFSGALAKALYNAQLYLALEDTQYLLQCETIMEGVVSRLNEEKTTLVGTSMAQGLAGLGFLADFLQRYSILNMNGAFDALDEYLFEMALEDLDDDNNDFCYGAFGTIYYFASKQPTAAILQYLNVLTDSVLANIVSEDTGTWIRNIRGGAVDPDLINMGLAHGQCGMLIVLIAVAKRLPEKQDLRDAIRSGVEFIISLKEDINYDDDIYNAFPLQFKKEDATPPVNRLAWCYSDLNEVLLFYRASELLEWDALKKLADIIGTETMMRTAYPSTLIKDSHFCHGSSGVAHIYKTLYQESKLDAYLIGYEYWIEQTILFSDEELVNNHYNGKETSLLDGLIGVGLTLLSYNTQKHLDWGKILLL